MFTRLKTALVLVATVALLGAMPGTSKAGSAGSPPTPVPTNPPPVCETGAQTPYSCGTLKRSDYFSKAICPGVAPEPFPIVDCKDPAFAPVAAMQCWNYGGDFMCEGAPWASDESLTYSWTVSSNLTVYQTEGNRSPLVEIWCRRITGSGVVTLTVTTAQGVQSTVSQYLSCML